MSKTVRYALTIEFVDGNDVPDVWKLEDKLVEFVEDTFGDVRQIAIYEQP